MSFEKFLQESVGAGYPLRDILDNLEDDDILASVNKFVELKINEASSESIANDKKFARKVYLAIQLLGGQSDILSSVSGWREHLSDGDVLGLIDLWIDAAIKELSASLKYVKRLHN
jgi:hypothetical protein